MKIKNFVKIVKSQDKPIRFLVSRFLKYVGLSRFIKIHRKGYQLHFHPSSLALSLWVNPHDRNQDSAVLQSVLKKGDSFWDVGANIGHLTLEASLLVGNSGRVTAVEANPRVFRFLCENIELNKCRNVRLMCAASGEHPGWMRFSDNRSDDQNSIDLEGSLEVPVVALDFFREGSSVSLLKIDVEGFELFVLRGAKNFLQNVEFVYFEAFRSHMEKFRYQFADIHRLLSCHGFSIGIEENNKIRPIPSSNKATLCQNYLAWRSDEDLLTRTGWSIEE